MKAPMLYHAYNECIELWKKRDFEGARTVLRAIPAGDHGPANQALRGKLELLLNASSPKAPPDLDETLGPVGNRKMASWRANGDGSGPTPRAVALQQPTPADPESMPNSVLTADQHEPHPGVSLVAACMNRQHNLLKVLPSWLATEADEIVIVDWSSAEPIWPLLACIDDPRIRVVRIDGESQWILTHALNVGLRIASRAMIFKLDCDIELAPDFVATNRVAEGEFVRGFWKLAVDAGQPDQRYTNGTFGAFKNSLRAINYYDERIVTYGWDDSDLYSRLALDLGLAGKLMAPRTIRHIDQEERQRLENQNVALQPFLGRFEATELEGAKNKYLTAMSPSWGRHFQAQDYSLVPEAHRLLRGRRTTYPLVGQSEIKAIAATLATRQLALWIADTLPMLPADLLGRLGFPRLLWDAHRRGAGDRLLASLRNAQGVHFVLCADLALRPALGRTLALILDHEPVVQERIVIVEGVILMEDDAAQKGGTHFVASAELIHALAQACGAVPLANALSLEETLRDGATTCTCTTISFDSLTGETLHKASRFETDLGSRFAVAAAPVAGSAMVTSLYDEHNLIRLVEYLTCVVLNLRVFERVFICYESHDGILHAIMRRLATQLALPVGQLVVLPYEARPTFEELFRVRNLLPKGTLLAAANADIAFDASFAELKNLDPSSTITVLSRWDVTDGGRDAALIRLEHGVPNTYSADAWIVTTPFEPDFFLDYPIGTMHCDSFINNQIGLSARYRVINPCFDVKVFHLHDERFNSSAQKQVRDLKEIQERYGMERSRNGSSDPVKGVGWSTLAGATRLDPSSNLQQWRPKALVINMIEAGAQLGGLVVFHLVRSFLAKESDLIIVVRLREQDLRCAVGDLLASYQAFFKANNVLLDFEDRPFNATLAEAQGTFIRRIAAVDLLSRLQEPDHESFARELYEFIRWPSVEGTKMLRSEVKIDLSSATQFEVIEAVAARHPWVLESLSEFSDSLGAWSRERLLLIPFVADLRPKRGPAPATPSIEPVMPRVSFVTSLFKGGGFLPGYLENVVLAAREANGEIIIVDANGDESDSLALRRFMQEHPSAARLIDYVQLDSDPGLYDCWRIAIERSRAPLITNANLDDRRSPWHTARLVNVLENNPELAGACASITCVTTDGANQWFSLTENQVWFYGEGSRVISLEDLYVRDEDGAVRSRNVMHCMPVWRKSLHDTYGYFDEEQYGTSADWAFWLKCAVGGEQFYFDELAFGRYFLNPQSHNRRNDKAGLKELSIIEDFLGVKQVRAIKQ
jgi:hypothetical protein